MADIQCVKCKAIIPDGYKACTKCGTPRLPDVFCTNKDCEYSRTTIFDPTATICPKCGNRTTLDIEVEKHL